MSNGNFYDTLAPLYHLVYKDWEASIRHQSDALVGVIREVVGDSASTILDVSCGIGTQALGLAALGYDVTASDVSAGALRRARHEARERDQDIRFFETDMRNVSELDGGPFDVVLSADNSVPHLLSDDEILRAFRAFHEVTRSGGAVILSVRDYDAESRDVLQLRPYGVREHDGARYIVFQVWLHEDPYYDVDMYFVRDEDGECETTVGHTRYYAIGTDRLMELLQEVGFRDVRRVDGRFFQPLIIGRRV